ncbi:MAG: hypothetical protein ACWGOV_10065 [Acidiferrobacterales bacterium]
MATAETKPLKSTSAEPDLDWSQVRETILMLNLATARIEFAMRDGDDSVETLTDSFTTIAGNVAKLRGAMDNVLDKYDIDAKLKSDILKTGEEVSSKMQSIIVAFQFYDKLVQRLAHISKSMAALGDLVGDPTRLYSPYEWKGLQEKIRSSYSMSDEKELLDALIGGASVEEVVRLMEEEAKAQGSEIEMF